jgi:hypothetical protein
MAEPEVEADGEPSSRAFTTPKRSKMALTIRTQRFVGRVMKPKLGGSKRSAPTTTFGGPSLALSLL